MAPKELFFVRPAAHADSVRADRSHELPFVVREDLRLPADCSTPGHMPAQELS
jgi:hypothetical protein